MTSVGHLADVLELRAHKAARRQLGDRDESVEGALVEVLVLEGDAVTEGGALEASFPLAGPLGTQDRVAQVVGRDAGLTVVTRDRRPRAGGVEEPGRLAGFAERAAELQRAEAAREEAFVGNHVREGALGVGLQPEVLPECGVPVNAQATGEEEAIPDSQDLLDEESAAGDRAVDLEGFGDRTRLEDLGARAGEVVAEAVGAGHEVVVELAAKGQRGRKAEQVAVVRSRVVERELPEGPLVGLPVAALYVEVTPGALLEVLVADPVDSGVEAVVHPVHRIPQEVHAAREVVVDVGDVHVEELAVLVIGVVAATAEHVEQKSLGVVAVGYPGHVPVRVEGVEPDVQVLRRSEGEVAAHVPGLLALRRARHAVVVHAGVEHALLGAPARGHEVVHAFCATAHRQVVALQRAVLQP